MEKYKDDLKTFLQVLTYILVSLSFVTVESPILSYTFLVLFLISSVSELYTKIQYRRGRSTYLLFPTYNDLYFKTTYIILGIMVSMGSIIAAFWTNSLNGYCIIGLCAGVLFFFNGIFELPNGLLRIENNSLKITGLKTSVDQRQLKEITIFKEKILLTNISGELIRIDNFNIDLESARLIDAYLSANKTNRELKIVNNVIS